MQSPTGLLIVLCCFLPACALATSASLPATASTSSALTAASATLIANSSTFYRFERFSLSSADQLRHYQVTLGLPNGAMPEQGYPVLYMLDGNAILPVLTDQLFARLQSDDWPVLVTLGYEVDAQTARVYDYTPSALANTDGATGPKLGDTELQFGGAEQFWQLLEQEVKPAVAQRVNIDTTRQTLWGHSFGGLFALHILFNHPASFQTYVVADASLWWQQGQILETEAAYRALSARPKAQLLMLRSASHRTGSVLPEDANRQLAKRLSLLPELRVQYYEYFQHHHGSIRAASVPAALRMAQGIEQQ